jgi:hypothetical protein
VRGGGLAVRASVRHRQLEPEPACDLLDNLRRLEASQAGERSTLIDLIHAALRAEAPAHDPGGGGHA